MATLGPVRKLSPRKQEIAELVARGLTNPQIARELATRHGRPMAVNTVRSHIRSMAFIFDDPPELPPRQRILLWLRQDEWARDREMSANKEPVAPTVVSPRLSNRDK